MSITLGIYDLFAYIIPGFLYLFVINDFLRHLGMIHISYSNLTNLQSGYALLLIIIFVFMAYLLGHLFDEVARWLTLRVLTRKRRPESALAHLKERYPNANIKFESKDWDLLFTLLRQRNMEHAQVIDNFQANNIMFRNILLGLVFIIVLQTYSLFTAYDKLNLLILLGALLLSVFAYQRNRMFHSWFFTDIFKASLDYGNNLEDVIAFGKNETSKTHKKDK